MNKRIEELWIEGTQTSIPREGDYSSVSAKNIEKFAELIVRECVDVANSKAEGIDLGSKLYLYTEDIEDTIKKHFGVEE